MNQDVVGPIPRACARPDNIVVAMYDDESAAFGEAIHRPR